MDSPCHAEEHGYFRGKRIGIFGGSFDPVHEGHIHLATLAKEAAALDEVWFLPCRVSPHKTGHPPSPGENRVAWLRIAIRDLEWAKVETIELERAEPSFSYLTLESLIELASWQRMVLDHGRGSMEFSRSLETSRDSYEKCDLCGSREKRGTNRARGGTALNCSSRGPSGILHCHSRGLGERGRGTSVSRSRRSQGDTGRALVKNFTKSRFRLCPFR